MLYGNLHHDMYDFVSPGLLGESHSYLAYTVLRCTVGLRGSPSPTNAVAPQLFMVDAETSIACSVVWACSINRTRVIADSRNILCVRGLQL